MNKKNYYILGVIIWIIFISLACVSEEIALTPTAQKIATLNVVTWPTKTPIIIINQNKEEYEGVKFYIVDLAHSRQSEDPTNQIIQMTIKLVSSDVGWNGLDVKRDELIIEDQFNRHYAAIAAQPECRLFDHDLCTMKVSFVLSTASSIINLYYVSDQWLQDENPIDIIDEENRFFIAEINLDNILYLPTKIPTITKVSTRTPTPSETPAPTATLDPSVTKTNTLTDTSTPTKTTKPSPTEIPPVTIEEIYNNFEKMTDLQFKEYKNLILGKKVNQRVRIANVSEDGKVLISGPWSQSIINFYDFCVVVNNVPRETALSLNGGQTIFLDARIYGLVGDYNYYWNCENTLILSYNDHR